MWHSYQCWETTTMKWLSELPMRAVGSGHVRTRGTRSSFARHMACTLVGWSGSCVLDLHPSVCDSVDRYDLDMTTCMHAFFPFFLFFYSCHYNFSGFKRMPLLFMLLKTCHYNFSLLWTVSFYTSVIPLDPLADPRIFVWPKIPLQLLSLPLTDVWERSSRGILGHTKIFGSASGSKDIKDV